MTEGSADRLLFLGDAYLPQPYPSVIERPCDVVFNLEHPITGRAAPAVGKVVLKAGSEHITATFRGTPRAACLANNHIMDYGEGGLRDTLDVLDDLGIAWFGAGLTSERCNNPLVLEVGGTTVGLSGYVCPTSHPLFAHGDRPGVAPIDGDVIARDVEVARSRGARRIIVCLHWGAEEVYLPRPEDVVAASRIMDLGVDLIVGHHAHRIQPRQRVGDGHVFYGLGNLFMPDIDLPSHFDDEGRPIGRFVKKQATWNRRSLAVDYRPSDGRIEVEAFHFDGRCAISLEGWTPDVLEPDPAGLFGYESRFRLSRFTGGLLARAWSYYSNPRLPAPIRNRLRGLLP